MRAFFNINCLKNPLPTDVGQEVLFLKDSNKGFRAPGRGINRTFLCRLVFRPNSLWVTLAEGRPGTHGPTDCFLLGLLDRAG